jgi:hypothetical protein
MIGAAMLLSVLALSGCAPQSYDYSAYQAHPPTSILVLPPINHSVDVKARDVYLSTVTRPLAEEGYYVFPVWLVDHYLRANGETNGTQIQAIKLSKLNSVFHPDAVLYTTINHFGQKYQILQSVQVVDVTSRLVDAKTGALLWKGSIDYAYDPNQGADSSLLAMLIGAALSQMLSKESVQGRIAATQANAFLFYNPATGLPFGPYNPKAKTDARR